MNLKQVVKFFEQGDDKNWQKGAIEIIDAILNKNVIRHGYMNMYHRLEETYYILMADKDIYYDILKVAKDKNFKDDDEALRYFTELNNIISITIYSLEVLDEKLYR